MKKYGFGIIGAGAVAALHAEAIQQINNAELKGVFGVDQAMNNAFAERFGCRIYSSMDEMGADPEVDFVSVCTPSGLHMETSVFMAEHGKHLIVEKPLEVTLERCDRIIEAAERNQVLLTGIFQTRFHSSAVKLKTAVNEGRFGKISLASAYVKWYRDQNYYDSSGWRGTWKLDGGGAIMNQSIHALDLLLWLMGPVKEVKAFGDAISHTGLEVEDTLTAVLKYANGALGTIEATTGAWPGHFKKIEICGDRGHAILEEDRISSWEFQDKTMSDEQSDEAETGVTDPIDIGCVAHRRQIEDAVSALENNRPPEVTGEDARAAVELALKLYSSAGLPGSP